MNYLMVNAKTRIIENVVHIEPGTTNPIMIDGYEFHAFPQLESKDGKLVILHPVEINNHKWVNNTLVDLNDVPVKLDNKTMDQYDNIISAPHSAPQVF